MKVSHIEHIGIAVESLDEAIPFYENVFGMKCYAIEEVADQKVKTAFFSDTGEVFRKINNFRFKDLRESYGIGFYLSYSKNTLLNFSVAHGNEGTQLYIKNKLAF